VTAAGCSGGARASRPGQLLPAHQAWYTARSPDAADWGIAAFAGRSAQLAEAMSAQDGLYTLITRAADGDRFG
jgi:fructuronate reductase